MKILIINPNSDINTDNIMKTKADRLNLPDVEVDIVHVEKAPILVSSYYDHAVSAQEMIDIITSTIQIYDGYIIACHSDPNLDLVRELAKGKPVVGIGEASLKMAAFSGSGFAVISPSQKSISKKLALARKYHCDHLLRTMKVTKSDDNEDLLAAAKEAIEEFCIESIVLGCANYSNADGYIEQELCVPVYEGVACALIIVSGLVRYNACKKAIF